MRKFLSILKKELIQHKDIFFKTNSFVSAFLPMDPIIDLTIKYTKNENTKI